ncbi:glycine--tRNA ligase subunit alpha, partial [Lactococcus lactis]
EVDSVTSEITYGLERIATVIQEVDSVYDLEWGNGVAYGDIFKEPEYEHSKFAFEESNQELLLKLFGEYEQEALDLLDKGLVHPAYDYILKSSHTFNLLDARGAVSVTERAGYMHRVRTMARKVAKTFIEERAKLGFPLLKDEALREKYLGKKGKYTKIVEGEEK